MKENQKVNYQSKSNVFLKIMAVTLSLALVVIWGTSLETMNGTADAEGVQLTQSTTVVTSPFTEAVKTVHGSVVGVNNYGMVSTHMTPNNFYGFGNFYGYENSEPEEMLQGSGSGVVVAEGYVLTNYHVVEASTKLEITIGNDTYPATLVAYDSNKDIAVLHNEELPLAPVVLGDSDLLQIGDWAICIGNPLSFTGTTTVGVISALNREIPTEATDVYGRRTDDMNVMIQTDAAINSGNSGGGMFNVAGELVGIPTMKYSGTTFSKTTVEGIGMAIPINEAKKLLQDVLDGKATTTKQDNVDTNSITTGEKPRIGVSITNLNSTHYAVANGILPKGAYISAVESGSPAEKAGVLVGDIVVEIDGTIITNTTEMLDAFQGKKVGDNATLKVYRVEKLQEAQTVEELKNGEYMDITVELQLIDQANP